MDSPLHNAEEFGCGDAPQSIRINPVAESAELGRLLRYGGFAFAGSVVWIRGLDDLAGESGTVQER